MTMKETKKAYIVEAEIVNLLFCLHGHKRQKKNKYYLEYQTGGMRNTHKEIKISNRNWVGRPEGKRQVRKT
jgi:hypothetical protein